MHADLDLLLTAVYVTADDLLPCTPRHARRSVTDAEVVTLCVAQAIMGIPSDRRFWGFRPHGIFAPDGTPRAVTVASPKRDEREVARELFARARRRSGETLIGDEGYAGGQFADAVSELDTTILRPKRQDEPGGAPHLAPIHQRVESIFWTCKGTLTLERHGAPTLAGLRERVLRRLLTLAAAMALNHQLGRPSRALVDYRA